MAVMLKWSARIVKGSCKSCRVADGQIHPAETWLAYGFYPRANKLICGVYCNCWWEEVDVDDEVGDIAVIPSAAQFAVRLAATGEVDQAGRFEVLAITEGVGNGWDFSAAVLQESLALWDGAECFVDHSMRSRSVRDLAGVFRAPAWDAERRGVRVVLETAGPSAGLVQELGRQVLKDSKARPRVGFSADLVFTAEKQKVTRIVKINSLDLVFNPARGGAFVRALNSLGGFGMSEEKGEYNVGGSSGGTDGANKDLQALQSLLAVQQERDKLAAEAEAARQVRAQMCGYLLESGLAAAKLPAAMAEHVRGQFQGKVFDAPELDAAIQSARKLVSDLTAASVVQGPGRISAMFDSRDKIQAAVDDLFDVPRERGMENLKAERLQGIRELYLMLTGDYDFHGGYDRSRVQLATTADFTGLVKNALNKIVVNTWEQLGKAGYDWWNRIATVEHFQSLNDITGTLVGTVGDLPTVAEGGEYPELAVGDSPETASFVKYGGYVPLTLELIDRDQTRKLKAYARELGAAGMRKVSGLVAAIFTSNSAVGPTMADTGALFNATAVTTKGGHANLLTTALAAAQWDVVSTAVFNQPMLVKQDTGYYGTGPKMAINPRYLLVPRALQLTGMKVLYPSMENTSNITSENQQRGAPGDVITVPEWTDTTDWAAVCDPRIAPAIYVGERFGIRPEVFIAGDDSSPAVFSNDEHRLKVRHFLAVWVNDFRPLHKSNV
jgi:hypothetical protein